MTELLPKTKSMLITNTYHRVYFWIVAFIFFVSSISTWTTMITITTYSNYTLPPISMDSLNLKNDPSTMSSNFTLIDSVLYIDEQSVEAAQATIEKSSAYTEWSNEALKKDLKPNILSNIVVEPFVASIDRRPSTVWKQLLTDNLHQNGEFLGCAFTTNTMAAPITHFKRWKSSKCSACFQFSNLAYANNFLKGQNMTNSREGSTVCVEGKVNVLKGKFLNWQKRVLDSLGEFEGRTGYPLTLDCILPNGIPDLTCRKISEVYNNRYNNDDVQNIYVKTLFTITHEPSKQLFNVHSSWPWGALQTHQDDRRFIANQMPKHASDTNSFYIPSNGRELKLAFIEGPNYTPERVDGKPSLMSTGLDVESKSRGGVHPRLMTNLINQILYAPNSTRLIGVPDGQIRATKQFLHTMLHKRIKDIFPKAELLSTLQPYINKCSNPSPRLMDLLNIEKIRIEVFAVPIFSLSYQLMLVGGQYGFTTHIGARYAADYQVIVYIDGDGTFIRHPAEKGTVQEVLFDGMFSAEKKFFCADQRFHLIEYKPYDSTDHLVYQCGIELINNPMKWKEVVSKCDLAFGHIIARCDSVQSFDVHHIAMDNLYVPKGVQYCEKNINAVFKIPTSKYIEMHMSLKERPNECVCHNRVSIRPQVSASD